MGAGINAGRLADPMTELRCAFCMRRQSAVSALAVSPHRLAGLPVAICRDCALSAALDMYAPEDETRAPGAERDITT